jgi:uncharacterized glyoxalase superfamily protein PhnB
MAQTTQATAALKAIPSLGVSDIERSVSFYSKFFGFQIVDSYEQSGRMAWCWLRANAAELMLQQLSADQQITLNPAIGQSWVLYIHPQDIDMAHAQLKQAGFPVSDIERTSYGARECFLSDPDGYELWLSVPSGGGNGADDDDDEDDEDSSSEDDDYEDEDDEDDEEEWKVAPRAPI